MMSVCDHKETWTYKLPQADYWIAHHFDKCLWFGLLCLAVFIVAVYGYSVRLIIGLVIFSLLPLLFSKMVERFAYSIDIDFRARMLRIVMLRSDAVIEVNFDDLQRISVNGYLVIVLKERQVLYFDTHSITLLRCLHRIRRIEWGLLCALCGPSKEIRDSLDSQEMIRDVGD